MLQKAEAQLISQLLQPFFYALYLITLVSCLRCLLSRPSTRKNFQPTVIHRTHNRYSSWSTWSWSWWMWRRSLPKGNSAMILIALMMGGIATFDVCLGFLINLDALVFNGGHGDVNEAFKGTKQWMLVMGTVDVIAQSMLGYSVLIYRCWLVYDRSLLLVSGLILLAIAGFICGILSILFQHIVPIAMRYTLPHKRVVTTTCLITICINVIATSLIVIRLWRVDRQCRISSIHNTPPSPTEADSSDGESSRYSHNHESTFQYIIKIVIESGLMYTTMATLTAIAFISGSNAFAPLAAVDVEMIGIAFNLIIIRADKLKVEEHRRHNMRYNNHYESSLRFQTLYPQHDQGLTVFTVTETDVSRNDSGGRNSRHGDNGLPIIEIQHPSRPASTELR